MNVKLFKKLNESLVNPIKKNSIVVTEEDEKKFIFGPRSNILPEVLSENYYEFNKDEYIAYLNAAEKKQKEFDRRRMGNRYYATKAERKEYEKEQHRIKKQEEKDAKDKTTKKINELQREIEENRRIAASEKNELLKQIEALKVKKESIESPASHSTSSLSDRQKVIDTYVNEINMIINTKKAGLNIDLEAAINEINRDPAYSSIPNSVKQASLNKAMEYK